MSWGGERADKVEQVGNLKVEVKRFEDEIERLGVRYNDLIPANILWDDRIQRTMFIDFEAASEIPGGVLQELSPNRKRKRRVEKEGVKIELVT